jgi:hypothetical protein
MHIATIISYCTNDYRFIGKCIEEAKKFSTQIIIPVCDHFFDGTPENRHLLNHTYAQHPDCEFIEFSYHPSQIYSQYHKIEPNDPDWAIFWAATTRYIGFHYLDPSIEQVLFLDSDEVVEGESFLQWIKSGAFQPYEAVRLAAYLYGLQPNQQAQRAVNLSLLVKRNSFAPLTLFNELERIGAYMSHPGPKREEVLSTVGYPMIHHYSWTRTKEECLWKTRTWSHRHDADWPLLIKEAFAGESERLFGSSQEFKQIEKCYFDPLRIVYPSAKASSSQVLKIDQQDLIRKELEYALL